VESQTTIKHVAQTSVGSRIGFTGTLISTENKNKLKIRFSDLNCFATVEIEKKYCRKLGV
jgi:predicted thioesterase